LAPTGNKELRKEKALPIIRKDITNQQSLIPTSLSLQHYVNAERVESLLKTLNLLHRMFHNTTVILFESHGTGPYINR
jgi:hypothetical protein